MNYLVTVNGEDQKGLVESLASTIEALGGNWTQSRLCRLEGQFAGIVAVEFGEQPSRFPEKVGTLRCEWKQLESSEDTKKPVNLASIKILAADRPGIIKQISHILASEGANVEEVESRVRSAPFSGEKMFEAHYQISLDSEADGSKLRSGLESLAEELMCDLDYKES